jgi:nicotinamide-nucleotide amidase
MPAAVLSIGTELTRGELVNSNASWLAEELTTLGFDVKEHLTIADDEAIIAEELVRLGERAAVVVCTGGLGPTSDDVTSAAVARAAGVPLERDESALAHLERLYASKGREMLDRNAKQADFPQGATVLPNSEGTAPGFEVAVGKARCFFLPGVPGEMRAMFHESVRPAVGALAARDTHQIHIRCFGLPESGVAELLADVESAHEGITLGYRAHFPEIEVKVHARAGSAPEAEAKAAAVAELVRDRLGEAVFGERDDSFAAVVGERLRAKKLTLAVGESCTGGMIGSMITDIPGSSDYLLLDAVTYANSAKTQILGVEQDVLRAYGAVSAECVGAMAEGARRLADSDVAVATTGIAGPGGGSDLKPVGTVWLGLARRDQPTLMYRHQLSGDRDRVRKRTAYIALDLVRRVAEGWDLSKGPSFSTCEEILGL